MLGCLGCKIELRALSVLLFGKRWANPLGLVNSQPVMNFDSLYTKRERFSVYFRKNVIAHLVAKQGKGRTPSKGFQEKPKRLYRVKEVLFLDESCSGFARNCYCFWGSPDRMLLSSGSLDFCINLTLLLKEALWLNYSPVW